MGLTLAEATTMVENYLAKEEAKVNSFGSALPGYKDPEIRLRIIADMTATHEFGWVFFYDSEAHLASGCFRDALAGNAPLIVDKVKRKLIETGTAQDTSYYVTNYINTGNPHSEA